MTRFDDSYQCDLCASSCQIDTTGLATKYRMDRSVNLIRSSNACAEKMIATVDSKELETRLILLRHNRML